MDSIKSGLDRMLSNLEIQALVKTMNDIREVEGSDDKEPLTHEEALDKALEVLEGCDPDAFAMYIYYVDKFGPLMTKATQAYMEARFNFSSEEVFDEV